MMKDRFKFRAVMKTADLCIVVPVEAVHSTYYTIDTNVAKEIFDKKYPEKCFFSDFVEIIEKQEYISQYSFDCDLLITKDFTNLMQCTGLKDKNGINLIFEGDILEITSALDNHQICRGTVIWWQTITSFSIKDWGCLDSSFSPYFKVIGNIYENSELLKGGV